MAKSGKAIKRLKAGQNFERNPPRCSNCMNYTPPVMGRANVSAYAAPFCKIGHFAVEAVSICDLWQSKDGEVIADSPFTFTKLALSHMEKRANSQT